MSETHCGFVAIAGRPNVGKSTLVNSLVGSKVAITSSRPQTTRRAIRGVITEGDTQIVLIDLPGVQRPRDVLTKRMQKRVEREIADNDSALLILNAKEGIGSGDRFTADLIAARKVPTTVVVNKIDLTGKAKTLPQLAAAATLIDESGLPPETEIFPVSALKGRGIDELREHLAKQMPASPFFFPPGSHTDLEDETMLAELVREQALRLLHEEVPHAVEVEVTELEIREDGVMMAEALLWVEADSQKGIAIGKGGSMIKEIGSRSRHEAERLFGVHLHIDLSVKVRKNWRGDERMIDRLGIQ